MERAIHLTRAGPRSGYLSGPAMVLALAAAKFAFHLSRRAATEFFATNCIISPAPSIRLSATSISRRSSPSLPGSRGIFFGESLLGLRLLPALAGAATVWLTGKLAREMGGRVFAQALAALAVIAAPIYLLLHHWLTMNAFEPLIWLGCAWCIVRAINRGEPRYWLWFGLLLGLGMENKYTTAFFALAVFAALLLTPQRRFLSNAWIWIGALCSLLIFLPNLIWLVRHDFPSSN